MATTLTFTKVRGKWKSGATVVNKNFNLHIEGGGSLVSVYQKTAGTQFCLVRESSNTGDAYDYDFGNYVYPKTIEVVCEENPDVAVLTEEA